MAVGRLIAMLASDRTSHGRTSNDSNEEVWSTETDTGAATGVSAGELARVEVGLDLTSGPVAGPRLILDGAFTDDKTRGASGTGSSVVSFRLLREFTLSSESDSDPESEMPASDSDDDEVELDATCSTSLAAPTRFVAFDEGML